MMQETGVGIINPLFFIGVVENNVDERLEGRVQVRAFGVHGTVDQIPTEQLPWSTLIIGSHDVNFVVPPINAWVFGFFIDGRDAQQPMVLGLIPTQMTEPVDPSVTGWGNPLGDGIDVNAQGSRPRDFGQPQNSRLSRGEELENTYLLPFDVNRIRNIPIAGGSANIHSAGTAGAYAQDHATSGTNYAGSSSYAGSEDVAPLARVIGAAESESEGGYNAYNRGTSGGRVLGATTPVDFSQLTVGEILQRGQLPSSDPNRLFAVGYYQIVADQRTGTLQSLVNEGVVNTNEYFTPEVQDRAGLALMERRGLSSFLNGNLSTEEFAYNLAGEWAGLPDPSTGSSRYGGPNNANVPTGDVIAALEETRENYNGPESTVDTTDDARAARTNATDANTVIEDANTVIEDANTTPASTGGGGGDTDAGVSGPQVVWEEPGPAYAAEYPYNRVIETGSGHSIEIDDTPGAERVVIYHKDGSYIQMSTGATSYKSTRDTFDINDRNHHVYIGGTNIVTIEGDSHVLVKGNKVEEIQGNYRQIIHGSHEVGVAGQMNFNGSDGGQIRAATLSLESNVENLHIKVGKSLKFQAGEDIHIKTNDLFLEGSNSINMKGATSNLKADEVFIGATGTFNLKSDTMFLEASGAGDFKANHAKIGGGNVTSINSSLVYIDDIVQLANGSATAPAGAGEGEDFEVEDAAEVNRPAPPEKSVPQSPAPSGPR